MRTATVDVKSVSDVLSDPGAASKPEETDQLVNDTGRVDTNVTTHDPDDWPLFEPLSFCYPWSVYAADWRQVKNEILAGLVVSFAQVPESVAFALLAGENATKGVIDPIQGLQAAWIVGLITSVAGGRTTMISGSTGAIAAVLATVPDKNFVYPIVVLSGCMIVLCGVFNLTKFARLIPHSAMIGFVNGLAIIIARSQFHVFHSEETASHWVEGWELFCMIVLSLVTFLIVFFLPKLTKAIPSSLAAILTATFIEYVIFRLAVGIETKTIADLGSISGGFPKLIFVNDSLELPPLKGHFFEFLVPALWITLVAISEDVMTIDVVSELTNTRPETAKAEIDMVRQQIIAMGSANIISGLCGTIGGGSTIGLSMINCFQGSNGKYRLSGLTVAIFVFCIVMVGSTVIGAIPASALVGIMCAVVYHTFEWHSVVIVLATILPQSARAWWQEKVYRKSMRKIQRADAFVVVLVTVLTIVSNLGIAIVSGLVFNCLVYAWESAIHLRVVKEEYNKTTGSGDSDDKDKSTVKVYHLDGPIFFGNARSIISQFTPKKDPKNVEIHLRDANIYDYSAMNALNTIGEKYKKLGKTVHLRHIKITSHKLLHKAHDLMQHFTYDTIEAVESKSVTLQAPDRLNVTEPRNVPV